MPVELKVPHVGESIHEVTIAEWLKREGDYVQRDEPLVSLETDKASLDVPAPSSGRLVRLLKAPGESAQIGEVLAILEEAGASGAAPRPAPVPSPATVTPPPAEAERADTDGPGDLMAASPRVMPAARRVLDEHGLRPQDITPTGPGGRLLKEDVLRHIDLAEVGAVSTPAAPPAPVLPGGPAVEAEQDRALTRGPFVPHEVTAPGGAAAGRREEVVPMTPLRRRIAERLVQSQQTTASLTTFNEIDMSAVMQLRQEYKEVFLERYGVKLGLMSFFVKAAIEALKQEPALNASISGDDIVYHHYYDIGVAVGGGRGLVVPVLRDAQRLSFAEIELAIRDFALRAQKNKLRPEELQGGTFTISNGGVYGSLLATPILNPPQSGILGMHNIQQRPVVVDGQVVVRPMMYVALTYDHRIVDGRESVAFLRRIKDCVERPSRILLEV